MQPRQPAHADVSKPGSRQPASTKGPKHARKSSSPLPRMGSSMRAFSDKRLYLALAILGFLLLFLPKALTWFEFGDGLPYHLTIAVQTAKGQLSGLVQPQPPLYYYMLAGVYSATQSIQITGLLSPIFSVLAVLAAFWFFRHHFDQKTSFLDSIIFLLTPDFVSIGTSTHIEPLLTALILVSFQLMFQNKNKLSGIAFGLAQLTKYS